MSLKTCTVLLAMMVGTSFAACAYPSKPTPTTTAPPQPTCEEPPQRETGYPDYDKYCKCPGTYKATTPGWGNPYLGLVRCDTKCAPANPTQRASHAVNDNLGGGSNLANLSACMNACTGSFEKSKRQVDDDYWFCHGVNFIEGELCEFIGTLGEATFAGGSGSNCFYIDGLDGPE
ncbi:hypothetical protein HD806DRAFT_493701 [Xylariaceae sp. AK1471]|nr:hypothetical protein HD806DRAFT_493701 [Xylariaceae sp. AK1471]